MNTPIDVETIKSLSTIAGPFINALTETWLKPKLSKLFKEQGTENNILEHAVTNKFEEYLLRTYEKQSFINVIAFQNQQKKLDDIYLTLKVVVAGYEDLVYSYDTYGIEDKIVEINDYKEEFIPAYKRILITDTAGMGKSTLLKFLFLSCIKNNKGIPIFINLRRLSKEKPILDLIYNELNPIDYDFDKEFVLSLIKRGDFVFFLDGYDEIPFNQREDVVTDLQDFISKSCNNHFVISSRPDSSLGCFSDFQRFSIVPLKFYEAFELLRKIDKRGALSEEIIGKLRGRALRGINEFLTNPFLVTLLYRAYEYKPTIPFKKTIFYRQVYDSLFESHDLTKDGGFTREKLSQLDIDDFHKILRTLGFITVKKGQIEFSKDEILLLLNQTKSLCTGINFKEACFLEDLELNVPLFNREGNYYRWAHKSIQEYFAAQFICIDAKSRQDEILLIMYKSDKLERYINVLDICFDLDYRSFRRTIIYDVICEFIKYYESTYCRIDTDQINSFDIHERKLLTFGHQHIIYPHMFDRQTGELLDPAASSLNKILQDIRGTPIYGKGGSGNCGLESFASRYNLIMQLLKEKNDETIQKQSKETVFVPSLDLLEALIIDDAPDSPINSINTFGVVNARLRSENFAVLDLHICKSIKQQIEQEIALEINSDFLTENL